jgi:hypothetical protein
MRGAASVAVAILFAVAVGRSADDDTAADNTGAAGSALEVSDDTPAVSGPIAITASRCDPHALIEYKRTFILSAYVALNGGERSRVDITAQGGARRALEELLRSCIG